MSRGIRAVAVLAVEFDVYLLDKATKMHYNKKKGAEKMIFPATEAIQETLRTHNMRCGVEEREGTSVVHVGITTDVTEFEVLFISHSEDNDVAMRIYNLIRFPAEKLASATETINSFNYRYRFLKFSVDTDHNTVDVEYDLPVSEEQVGEAAFEILMRSAHILDLCYPELMQLLSDGNKEEMS